MSENESEIDKIDIEEVTVDARPVPPNFRELLALALKTIDPEVLGAAERSYKGRFASVEEFIRETLALRIPPELQWLLRCVDPTSLRLGYEGKHLVIWTIGVEGGFLVFESLRDKVGFGVRFEVPIHDDKRTTVRGGEQ